MRLFLEVRTRPALVNPAAYETLGIEGGHASARRNRHHTDRVRSDLAPLTAFLGEVGSEARGEVSPDDWRPARASDPDRCS